MKQLELNVSKYFNSVVRKGGSFASQEEKGHKLANMGP